MSSCTSCGIAQFGGSPVKPSHKKTKTYSSGTAATKTAKKTTTKKTTSKKKCVEKKH